MAIEFSILAVGAGMTKFHSFELPVPGTFGAQSETYISILTLQPGLMPPAAASYIIRQQDQGVEVAVPSVGPPADLMSGGSSIAQVSLVGAVVNGLATIRITHAPTPVSDTQLWQIKVSHAAAVNTDFFGVIAHTQNETRVPKLSLLTSSPLDFGRATFNATRKRSAQLMNSGTADLTLGTISLSSNPTNFYALTQDPSGALLSPNSKAAVEIGYTPLLPPNPPPAPPHLGTLTIPASPLPALSVSLTGSAMIREIVLLIDSSDSMNATSAGMPLSHCPVGSTLAANYEPASRTRQVRAALNTFQSKLTAFGDRQVFLSIVQFPGGHLSCGSSYLNALASSPTTWKLVRMPRTLYDQTNAAIGTSISQATDFAFYHATPMTAGLQEAIAQLSSTTRTYKVILLLSDGVHNVPTDPGQAPLTLMPTLTSPANPIRVCAIAFGNSSSVDHSLLQQLASQTGAALGDPLSNQGFFAFDPTVPGNLPNLEKYYTEIFTDLFELQGVIDPVGQISRGAINQHKALITEFDQRVTFTLSWTTPYSELLECELSAPNGQRVGPDSALAQYVQGPKHKMYTIDVDRLPPDFVGEWVLEITYGRERGGPGHDPRRLAVSGGPKVETYHYDVITRSGLELKVKFDKQGYRTGDRIVVSGQLTENGRPLLGQTVAVQVWRPDQGMGNWHAAHPTAPETIRNAFAQAYEGVISENYSLAYQKQFYLTQIAGVPLPAQITAHPGNGFPMLDDGQNADLKAQDGIYTAVLEGLAVKPGTDFLLVVATGQTSNGTAFRRECLVHLPIATAVDTTLQYTQVRIEAVTGVTPGLRRFRVVVRPQDALGNLLGPGFASVIKIQSVPAAPLTAEVQDDLVGGYFRDFEYDPSSIPPVVEIAVGEASLPPQVVGPALGVGSVWRKLYAIFPWLPACLASGRCMGLLLMLILLLLLILVLLLIF